MFNRRRLLLLVCVILITLIVGAGTAAEAATYQVQKGDSLWRISNQYQVPTETVKRANELHYDMIYVGQWLVIPERYAVQSGDSLWKIANRHGITVLSIRQVNNIWDSMLYPGQVLYLPYEGERRSIHVVSRGLGDRDLELLARAVYAESRGEPYLGQVAVAAVIMNRIYSHDFPNTLEGVIYQPWAFESVDDGQITMQPDTNAYTAAQEALKGNDPTGGALYFWNPVTARSSWVWTREIVTQIGQHVFAR